MTKSVKILPVRNSVGVSRQADGGDPQLGSSLVSPRVAVHCAV